MHDNLTQAIEDYLKIIYTLTTDCASNPQPRASTNQIAKALGVTPASVTGMLKKLSETRPPLVDYQKHRGVALTTHGERIALRVLRLHRLLEQFLHQILGYNWDEVHTEADRLEHVISQTFEERIAIALGNPSQDPHGDPIPSPSLQMPEMPVSIILAELRNGDSAVISRVDNTDPELLRYLRSLGLVPQARLVVLDISPFDQNLNLQVAGQPTSITLGPTVTRKISVQLVSK